MDPAYATQDPSTLYVTTSGLAMDINPTIDPATFTPAAPILYDPSIMSTPWYDSASGLYMAQQADGTVAPVAVSSSDIVGAAPSWWTPGMTTAVGTGLQSLLRTYFPTAFPAVPVPGTASGILGGMSGTTLLLLGVGAYFLLWKRR